MNFNNQFIDSTITFNKDYSSVTINGSVKNPLLYKNMLLIAPAPIDRMSSYSGSGLPFPSFEMAIEGTPNRFEINTDGVFSTTFMYPNSFYEYNYETRQKDKIISSIFVILTDYNYTENMIRIELKDLCVLRTLLNRSGRKNPEFYAAKDYLVPITTAENIMMDYYSRAKIEHDIG